MARPTQHKATGNVAWLVAILALLLTAGALIWMHASEEQRGFLGSERKIDQSREIQPASDQTVAILKTGNRSARAQVRQSSGSTTQLLGIQLQPRIPVTGSRLSALAEIAPREDGTENEPSPTFTWWVNGSMVQQSDAKELATDLKRDDEVVVEASVVAPDGTSQAVRERVVVSNAGPEIELIQPRVEGFDYQAIVRAVDPENDAIQYSCIACPDGMTFALNTLNWKVPETPGTYPVEIMVRDDSGEGSTAAFSISVSPQGGIQVDGQ